MGKYYVMFNPFASNGGGGYVPPGGEGKTFYLANDISNVGLWIRPIGNESTPFKGVFNGASHSISGIEMYSGDDYIGLFGYVQSGGHLAQILNLNVVDCDINGANFVGAICGYIENADILSCAYSGHVVGDDRVGGICGYAVSSNVQGCSNYGNGYSSVSGDDFVGGIVGECRSALALCTIDDKVSISGINYVGGLFGRMMGNGAYGNQCLSAANEIHGSMYVGGIGGSYIQGHSLGLSDCMNLTSLNLPLASCVGGIVGNINTSKISCCYNAGSLSGSIRVGGICANITGGDVSRCYNIGNVEGSNSGPITGTINSGGTVSNCFFDKQMCPIDNGYGIGRLTEDMVSYSLEDDLGASWLYQDDRYPALINLGFLWAGQS